MSAVAWSYPQGALLALKRKHTAAEAARPVASGIEVEQLSFNYVITGDDPAWLPLRAFDDGRQPFIQFPASLAVREVPPLFLVGAQAAAELINSRLSGRYYVVERLINVSELERYTDG